MKKLLSLAALLSLTLLGCGSNNGSPVTGAEPAPAELRVAHLSPDAPNVDVWVDGEVVLPNVPYQAVSGYLPVPPGSYRVQVTPAGATEPVVIDATLPLTSGVSYTVAATGLLADIQPIVLVDDRTAGDGAKVRFVHAGADAPPVDVTLTDGTVLFSDVAFRETDDDLAASDGYLLVDAGTYDLQVRVAGTDTVALELPGTMLGGNVTVFAIGLLADTSLGALPVSDN